MNKRIAIVGAGLMGRLLAWRLLLRRHRVWLFEAAAFDGGTSASYVAAGMIAPLSELVKTRVVVYEMGMASLRLWREWLPQLGTGAGAPPWFRDSGSIVVAHAGDEGELAQFERDLRARFDNAVPGLKCLDEAGLRAAEPSLAGRFRRGLLLRDEACIDNRELLRALLCEVRRLGGCCRDGVAVRLQSAGGALVFGDGGRDNRDERRDYDWVLDCRGVGARDDLDDLRAVRGEVLRVRCDAVPLQHTVRLMHPRYQLYLAPRPGNRFVIGATEIESADDSPLSVQSALELCGALYAVHPGFAEARIEDASVGLRPAFSDNLPRVRRRPEAPGIISVNGLYRYGFMVAPVVAEHVLGMIEERPGEPRFADPLDGA